MNPSKSSRPDQLATLTAVRFFAAFWVVVYHYNVFGAPLPKGMVGEVISNGHFGVAFFFVLSGFILAHTYATRIRAPKFDRKPFLLARFARVYPLYVAALLLGGIQQMIVHGPGTPQTLHEHPVLAVATNLLLIQNWNPLWVDAINGPGWSIACEAAFYLSFPFLANLILKSSPARLIGIVVIGMIFGLVMDTIGTNIAGAMAVWQKLPGDSVGTAMALGGRFLPFARFDEFMLGIVAFRALHEFRIRYILIGATGLSIGIVTGLILVQRLTSGRHMPISGFPIALPFQIESLFPIASALLIIGLARSKGQRPSWLAHPVLVYGGKISFALYLVHLPILFLLLPLMNRVLANASVFGLAFVASLLVAAAGYRWIEEPMRNRILAASRRARNVPEPFPAAP